MVCLHMDLDHTVPFEDGRRTAGSYLEREQISFLLGSPADWVRLEAELNECDLALHVEKLEFLVGGEAAHDHLEGCLAPFFGAKPPQIELHLLGRPAGHG